MSLLLLSTRASKREEMCAVVSIRMVCSNLELPVLTAVCSGDKRLINAPKSYCLCESDSDVRIRHAVGKPAKQPTGNRIKDGQF